MALTGKQKAIMAIIGLFSAAGVGGLVYKNSVVDVINADCGSKIERVGNDIKITPSEAVALAQANCKTNPNNIAGASDTVEITLVKGRAGK